MRRYLRTVGAAVFAFTVITMTAKVSSAVDHGREFININSQKEYPDLIKTKDKRWVPHFPHRLHQEKYLHGNEKYGHFKYTDDWVCKGCHHLAEKGYQPQACLKCKDASKMIKKVKGKFENIYHNTCRNGCHKAKAKSDKAKFGFLEKCEICHRSKPGEPYKYP